MAYSWPYYDFRARRLAEKHWLDLEYEIRPDMANQTEQAFWTNEGQIWLQGSTFFPNNSRLMATLTMRTTLKRKHYNLACFIGPINGLSKETFSGNLGVP